MKYWIVFILISLLASGEIIYFGNQIISARKASLESSLQATLINNLVSVSQRVSPRQSATLLFVGDIMLSRAVGRQMEKNDDYTFPFKFSSDFLKSADITFGNLEGPISHRGNNQGSIYSFRANSRVVEGLIQSGFDVLSIANNHIWDWGRDALSDTLTILQDNNITPVGAGENFNEANSIKVVNSKGLKIGFLAYTNLYPKSLEAEENEIGISQWDVSSISNTVYRIKQNKEADIVVVSLHWGNEYEINSSQWQKDLAHKLIDAGADIIAGHHPHVAQEMERYKDGVIFYSLGNFIFDQSFSKETMEGLAGEVVLEGNKIKDVKTYKVPINQYFQPEIVK
ncbi:MAG: CapA family protein [Candidatus Paceibacterota bacterium]|jgi:poly-gamma-glutamate synthesis protein (capsule biosynthesis protein)